MSKIRQYIGIITLAVLIGWGMVATVPAEAAPAATPAATAPAAPNGTANANPAAGFTGKLVTGILVQGNQAVAEKDILKAVKVKPGDKMDPEKVKQDMRAIYEQGYFFDVSVNFTEVPEGVKITYTVMENPVLQEIKIKGNTKVPLSKIMSLITVKKNEVLNAKLLNQNNKAIESYYRDQGYILAKVSDVNIGKDGVLTLTISEGILEDIQVKGNVKTKSYVVTRELNLKKGEAFNSKDAKRSIQKIYNLGIFEDVNLKLKPGREPNTIIMEITIVEQKTAGFSVGGGYSKDDGAIGMLEVKDDNFRGTGDKVKFRWEFGGKASNRNYDVAWFHPWLDKKQTSLNIAFYNMTKRYTDYGYNGDDRAERSKYDRKRRGFEISLGRPVNDFMKDYITLKSRRDIYEKYVEGPVDYGNTTDPNYQNYLHDNFGLTRSITWTRILDTRDNVYNASEGKYFSVSAEIAGKGFGGDFNFNKYQIEGRRYFKINESHIIAIRGSLGVATGSIPETMQFSVGGADTLRGYKDDQFKGNRMFTFAAEYRFPFMKKVQGVVFGDIGNAWNDTGYSLKGLKCGFGVGVRMMTPLGAVRLDFARGTEGFRTHFSFGGQF